MLSKVEIIGVPLDLGANLRGANMGPSAIRIAGLNHSLERLGYTVQDDGDLFVPVRESIQKIHENEHFLSIIKNLSLELSERTYKSLEGDKIPITIVVPT